MFLKTQTWQLIKSFIKDVTGARLFQEEKKVLSSRQERGGGRG
jgi:hypothetical protein